MAERHTLNGWAARVNIADEPLTMEEAMLMHLGYQNAQLEHMVVALQDTQMRLQRLEMYLEADNRLPGYAKHAERMRQQQQKQPALAEARNGSGEH